MPMREGAGLRILAGAGRARLRGRAGPLRLLCRRARRRSDPCRAEAQARHAAGGSVDGFAAKDYGQRELLIRAPDGQLFVFGAEIRE